MTNCGALRSVQLLNFVDKPPPAFAHVAGECSHVHEINNVQGKSVTRKINVTKSKGNYFVIIMGSIRYSDALITIWQQTPFSAVSYCAAGHW
ncbi:hypothetical protein GJAV_G00141300 [Gymnothorax javanicus]|nr:hypothetical protein GJAV_G00141300 [Gymnothorax javanicus]